MKKTKTVSLSRRQWLGQTSKPVIISAIGSALIGSTNAVADDRLSGAGRDDRYDTRNSGARVYNVRDFGAKGDGATLDTLAVQAAIDACTKDMGGVVLIPAGVFVVGTIELKSNVTLRL